MDQAPDTKDHTPHGKPPIVPIIAAVALLLVLFLVMQWSSNIRAETVARNTTMQCVDALGVALTPAVLDAMSAEARGVKPEKLRKLCLDVRSAGAFREVSITRPDGTVIVSTNAANEGTKIELGGKIPIKTTTAAYQGATRYVRGIALAGDNIIGVVVVDSGT